MIGFIMTQEVMIADVLNLTIKRVNNDVNRACDMTDEPQMSFTSISPLKCKTCENKMLNATKNRNKVVKVMEKVVVP